MLLTSCRKSQGRLLARAVPALETNRLKRSTISRQAHRAMLQMRRGRKRTMAAAPPRLWMLRTMWRRPCRYVGQLRMPFQARH